MLTRPLPISLHKVKLTRNKLSMGALRVFASCLIGNDNRANEGQQPTDKQRRRHSLSSKKPMHERRVLECKSLAMYQKSPVRTLLEAKEALKSHSARFNMRYSLRNIFTGNRANHYQSPGAKARLDQWESERKHKLEQNMKERRLSGDTEHGDWARMPARAKPKPKFSAVTHDDCRLEYA
jgi:hypothetical protein